VKCIANPVEVEAFVIADIDPGDLVAFGRGVTCLPLRLSDGSEVLVGAPLLARMTPRVGDYYVVRDDGYKYLELKAVFERSYRLAH
jgi:hypothetical protein